MKNFCAVAALLALACFCSLVATGCRSSARGNASPANTTPTYQQSYQTPTGSGSRSAPGFQGSGSRQAPTQGSGTR